VVPRTAIGSPLRRVIVPSRHHLGGGRQLLPGQTWLHLWPAPTPFHRIDAGEQPFGELARIGRGGRHHQQGGGRRWPPSHLQGALPMAAPWRQVRRRPRDAQPVQPSSCFYRWRCMAGRRRPHWDVRFSGSWWISRPRWIHAPPAIAGARAAAKGQARPRFTLIALEHSLVSGGNQVRRAGLDHIPEQTPPKRHRLL